MKAAAKLPAHAQSDPIAIKNVDREVNRRLSLLHGPGTPVQRACMSNLAIYCDTPELVEKVSAQVPEIVALHPCRVLRRLARLPARQRIAEFHR